ncbi:MAG: helix-turn-helix transcriptional regulator [Proteobacteria bacterium]|nr:helix-turn-helix transcriptional regulator [Pseudomonadota bacterium]
MRIQRDYGKILKILSSNIRRLRLERGLTQEDMADYGFNYRHYQKLESGTYSPNLQTLHRLAIALNTEISNFFN